MALDDDMTGDDLGLDRVEVPHEDIHTEAVCNGQVIPGVGGDDEAGFGQLVGQRPDGVVPTSEDQDGFHIE
jgi:hypothetical protein